MRINWALRKSLSDWGGDKIKAYDVTLIPKKGAEPSMIDMKQGVFALFEAIQRHGIWSPNIGYKHMDMLNMDDKCATSFVPGICTFLVSAAAQGGWYHHPYLTLGFQTCLSQVYLSYHCRHSH